MNSEFDVPKNTNKTVHCHDNINIISIKHIDIDPSGYAILSMRYTDGTNLSLRFKGNGGLIFSFNGKETENLTKGTWNISNMLQMPVFFTSICTNTYYDNSWQFCTQNYLSSVEFSSSTTWSGLNSVKVFSSFSVPLYFRGPVTSMQEHNEKIVISASNISEANYLKSRFENYHKNRFFEYDSVNIDVLPYPNSEKFVFKCHGNIKKLMHTICGSNNFFSDGNGFICCKLWYDYSLLNTVLGTKLTLEQTPIPPAVPSVPAVPPAPPDETLQ
jgi:hypothetical protein